MIVERLMEHVRRVGWAQKAFLGVFAKAGTEPFYARHGFRDWGDLTGMYQVVREEDKG